MKARVTGSASRYQRLDLRTHADTRFHTEARAWLEDALRMDDLLFVPWMTILGVIRITTNRKAMALPVAAPIAMTFVRSLLSHEHVAIPSPGPRHLEILESMAVRYDLRGPDLSDAHLAALAVEHDLTLVSFDHDFEAFVEVRVLNPAALAH
ncbi:MAG: TA system VapC family ribonuclease toxin [Dehalococcoidia bacterium]